MPYSARSSRCWVPEPSFGLPLPCSAVEAVLDGNLNKSLSELDTKSSDGSILSRNQSGRTRVDPHCTPDNMSGSHDELDHIETKTTDEVPFNSKEFTTPPLVATPPCAILPADAIVEFRLGPVILHAQAIRENGILLIDEVEAKLLEHSFPDDLEISMTTPGIGGAKRTFWKGKTALNASIYLSNGQRSRSTELSFDILNASGAGHDLEKLVFHADMTVELYESAFKEPLDKDRTYLWRQHMKLAEEDLTRTNNIVRKDWHKKYPHSELYQYVLIKGLFTNHYPVYFVETAKAIERLDLPVTIAEINTEESIEANAEVITKQLVELYSKTNAKLVLIAHSKGGLDVLEGIRLYTEQYKTMVYALISIQCPYWGTPAVDLVRHEGEEVNITGVVSGLIDTVMSSANNVEPAIVNLGYHFREPYMRQLTSRVPDGRITTLYSPIKFINVCTFAEFRGGPGDLLNPHELVGKVSMSAVNTIIEQTGLRSDGLCAQPDCRLPGNDVILLPDAFHNSPMHFVHRDRCHILLTKNRDTLGNRYHSGAVAQALLAMLFELDPP